MLHMCSLAPSALPSGPLAITVSHFRLRSSAGLTHRPRLSHLARSAGPFVLQEVAFLSLGLHLQSVPILGRFDRVRLDAQSQCCTLPS